MRGALYSASVPNEAAFDSVTRLSTGGSLELVSACPVWQLSSSLVAATGGKQRRDKATEGVGPRKLARPS